MDKSYGVFGSQSREADMRQRGEQICKSVAKAAGYKIFFMGNEIRVVRGKLRGWIDLFPESESPISPVGSRGGWEIETLRGHMVDALVAAKLLA